MTEPLIVLCTLPIVLPGDEHRFMDKQKAFRGPRLGVQVIRDYLVKNDIPDNRIKFLDIEMLAPTDDVLRDYFKSVRPEIVGLSAVLSHSYQQVKRISALIRSELPNSCIVVGGNLSASANIVLRNTDVDFCVVGDGEEVFLKLTKYVRQFGKEKHYEELGSIRGLAFLDKDGETYFESYAKRPSNEFIPLPDYEFFKSGLMGHEDLVSRYFLPVEKMGNWFCLDSRTKERHRKPYVAQFFTSKGCTARCTFCQRNTRGYRLTNLDDIEAHLQLLIEKYDVGFISCMDENFGSRREHARAFADLMAKYDLLWTATGVRCVNVTPEDIKYFNERGCTSLKFGVESGSQEILDSMEKNFTIGDVEKALGVTWENGMYSPLALMVGMPGETLDTVRETGQFIGNMAYKLGVPTDRMGYALFYALPFPGTPLYEHCVQVGLIEKNLDAEERYLVSMANSLTNKWHYLNVNGAKPIDILSWDYLVEWEAAKKFAELDRNNTVIQSDLAKAWEGQYHATKRSSTKYKLSLNRRFSLFLILTLMQKFYQTKFVRKLPRWLAYTIIRTSFFAVVFSYHWLGRIIGRPSFSMYKDRPRPVRFSRPFHKKNRLERSLRAVVNQKRQNSGGQTDKAREKLLIGAAN